MKFDSVEFTSVEVSSHTTWTHALFTDTDGLQALVEIPSGAATGNVVGQITRLVSQLRCTEVASEAEVVSLLGLEEASPGADRTLGSSVSALRTATVQLEAERHGVSLTEMLGGVRRDSVELYANINRALFATDRTPAAFARIAERAARAGFSAFKCAPFDEVRSPSSPILAASAVNKNTILDLARPGLERVAAVRGAIGPGARLMVDCHSRFGPDTAPIVARELSSDNLAWFEEPVQPTGAMEDLARISAEVDIPVAGGESGYGVDLFGELIASGATAVIMPDAKHCGGVGEAARAGRQAVAAGAGFSLHCPSGPISLLASGHVTAAVEGAMPLEHAVFESEWRAELLEPPERVEGGRLWFPEGSGLGARLNDELLRRFGRRWKPQGGDGPGR